MPFSDQVVLVTGAAGNLGPAVSGRFAKEGARLVLTDLSEERLQQAAAVLDPGRTLAVAADVTEPSSAKALVEKTIQRFGRIDVLANLAGGFRMGPAVHETPLADWAFMLNLNATSVLVMAQAVVPVMLDQKRGRIVNVSARAALHGSAHLAAYSAAKAAVLRLTESMAAELLDHGITVNCVLPSIIDTPQNRAAMPQADFDRWVAPESLADVIAFLASAGAKDVSGAAIPVYGKA